MDEHSIREYYSANDVFPKFMHGYFELFNGDVNAKISQNEIYAKYVEFCALKRIPVLTIWALGKYLRSITPLPKNGPLYWIRGDGNRRFWLGLKAREVPNTDTKNFQVAEYAHWCAPYDPTIHDTRPPGRPFKGDEKPYLERDISESYSTRGKVNWRELNRTYRHFRIIQEFEEQELEKGPRYSIYGYRLWEHFDAWCLKKNVPTTSLVVLRKELRLTQKRDVRGVKYFPGVTTKTQLADEARIQRDITDPPPSPEKQS